MSKIKFKLLLLSAAAVSFAISAAPLEDKPMRTKPLWALPASCALDPSVKPPEAPHAATCDAGEFTVRMEFTLPAASDLPKKQRKKGRVKILSQETEGTGWSVGFYRTTGGTCQLEVFLNGNMHPCGFISMPKKDAPSEKFRHTLIFVSRPGGIASFYVDPWDWFGKTCHFSAKICPVLEPVKVGDFDSSYLEKYKSEPFTGIEVKSLAFYGPNENWYPLGATKEMSSLTKAGPGWSVELPGDTSDPKRPRVFLYGDSILWGYRGPLSEILKDKAYVFSWVGWTDGWDQAANDPEPYIGAASCDDFSAVVFNNTLHSLHWGLDKVSDDKVKTCYRNLVHVFRKGAPKAKIFYLSGTPQIGDAPKGQKATKVGKNNPVVERLNHLAAEVMKEEKVEYIDVYSVLAGKLELANGGGDKYHWTKEGYHIIADAIANAIIANWEAKKK